MSRRILAIFSCFFSALLLSSCMSQTSMAPVVDAWYQPNAKQSSYRVKRGDTLYSIAWAYGLDYRALAAANHLSPPYAIQSGQILRMTNIPQGQYQPTRTQTQTGRSSSPVTRARVTRSSRVAPTVWVWPARGRIIQRFSAGLAGNHGIDIAGRLGEPVVAAASGRVVYSGDGVRGYGNLIIIKHNNDYLSAYAYNQRLLIRLGQRVRAGQRIALMGHNNAGTVMLHFEIRRNGRPVNPLNYLK